MSKVVHLECLGRLLCLEALNMGGKKKSNWHNLKKKNKI